MYIDNVTTGVFGRCVCTNRIFPEHSAGTNRLYYVNDGEMLLKSGKSEIVMKKGHLYLLPHSNINTITTQYVDHSFLHFYTMPQISNNNIIDIDISNHPVLNSVFEALNMYINKNPRKSISSNSDKLHFVGSLVANVLFLMSEIKEITVIDDALVNEVIEYIHLNYNLDITITDLAAKFHMEQNSFIRRFKKLANVTPYQYLKKVRVNMALALMKGDKYDLQEIAQKVGYSDASALSHAIKKCITI